jgi:hypothetical protein
MNWYPRSCPVCTGDLHDDFDDKGWVTCFMCARTFRASELPNLERGAWNVSGRGSSLNGLATHPIHETESAMDTRAA